MKVKARDLLKYYFPVEDGVQKYSRLHKGTVLVVDEDTGMVYSESGWPLFEVISARHKDIFKKREGVY